MCGQCSVTTMMAVCGASSLCGGQSSFHYECMDPCPSSSPADLQTSLLCWGITKLESEASSCLSATMGNSTDPEDSGASQPPPWSTGDGQQMDVAPTSQPESLEITVPSSNDQQESGGVSQGHLDTSSKRNMVQEDSVLQVVNIMKEEGSEYPSEVQVKQEEFTVASKEGAINSPTRKRVRMGSPSSYTLQERLMSREGEVSLFRHSSPTISNKGATQDLSGKWKETGPSVSSHSGEQPSKGGQQQELWWLTPRSSPAKEFPVQPQSMLKKMKGRDFMGDSVFEGGGQRSTSKETDCPFKSPSYNPHMLNTLDNKQGVTASQTALSSHGGSITAEPNTLEHPFLSPQEFTSSRLGGSNVAPDVEDSSRVANLFPGRRVAGGHGPPNIPGHARDAVGVNDGGYLERHRSLTETAQHPPLESTSSETRDTTGLPLPINNSHGNANTNFYAHIRGAMPLDIVSPQVFPSENFSQAGVLPTFTQDPLSFGLSTTELSSIGHPHAGQAPQFLERNLQQISKDMIARSLQANAQSSIPVPTFMSSLQTTESSHANAPDFSSLEFLHVIQRSNRGPPQGSGSYVSNFRFSSAPATSQYGLVLPELNLSLPAQGSQASALAHSVSSQQEFLTPAQGSYCHVNHTQRPEDGFWTRAGDVTGNHGLSKSLQLDLSVPTSAVSPSVTAVVEGRSIGQRVCLCDYDSYEGFAQAMRKMFEDCILEEDLVAMGQEIHLGNAIPGYVIAYEDEEGDLLLAGDLGWR